MTPLTVLVNEFLMIVWSWFPPLYIIFALTLYFVKNTNRHEIDHTEHYVFLRKQLIQNAEVVCGKTKYTRTNSIEMKSVSSSQVLLIKLVFDYLMSTSIIPEQLSVCWYKASRRVLARCQAEDIVLGGCISGGKADGLIYSSKCWWFQHTS